MFGFFSIRIAILVALSVLVMPTGTTAPFSAISGALSVTASDFAGAPPPRAFITSSMDLAANAALFHSAASASLSRPEPAMNETSAVNCSTLRRFEFIMSP